MNKVALGVPQCANRAGDEARRLPWSPLQLRNHGSVSGQFGNDDRDLNPTGTEVFDCVRDESTCGVVRTARVGGREDRDLEWSGPVGRRKSAPDTIEGGQLFGHRLSIGSVPVVLRTRSPAGSQRCTI